MSKTYIIVAAVLAVTVSHRAEARQKRDGFNFGTSVRVMDSEDSSLKGNETFSSTKTSSTTEAVSPYMGYVFGQYFNLGIQGLFETRNSEQHQVSADEQSEVERSEESSLKGGSIFMRFLFANYMYFEGGIGLYDQRVDIHNEYRSNDGTAAGFSGRSEDYNTRGLGPGYHLGFGVEVPVTNGFYFSTSYLSRIYQIRDYAGGSDLGSKRARVQTREVAFGLSHYLN